MTGKSKAHAIKCEDPFIPYGYHIELNAVSGGIAAVISRVVGIQEITDDFIKIMTKNGNITVSGSSLQIHVFEYKTLQISGKIDNLSFSKKERTRGKRYGENR